MSESKVHTTTHGRIRYTSNQPQRLGQVRGREWFTITRYANGERTLAAHCEIDDAPSVVRDVVQTVGPGFEQRDCLVRLTVGGELVGSSWFRFTADRIECEGYNVERGRFSESVALDGAMSTFTAHPIQGDAWHLHLYDRSRGPGRALFPNLIMSSLDHRGATGPCIERHPQGLHLEYVGEERVEVAAGSFDAWHFRYAEPGAGDSANEPGRHPPYDIWCTADGEYVFLKAHVGGYMQTAYELVELEYAFPGG